MGCSLIFNCNFPVLSWPRLAQPRAERPLWSTLWQSSERPPYPARVCRVTDLSNPMPHLRGLVFGLISHFSLNSSFLFCSFQNINKKFLFTFVCTVLNMVSWHHLVVFSISARPQSPRWSWGCCCRAAGPPPCPSCHDHAGKGAAWLTLAFYQCHRDHL